METIDLVNNLCSQQQQQQQPHGTCNPSVLNAASIATSNLQELNPLAAAELAVVRSARSFFRRDKSDAFRCWVGGIACIGCFLLGSEELGSVGYKLNTCHL